MIRRPPRSTLFPYTTPLPICWIAKNEKTYRLGVSTARVRNAWYAMRKDLTTKPAGGVVGPAELDSIAAGRDRKSTRLNSSHANISYAVFCLKKKKKKIIPPTV